MSRNGAIIRVLTWNVHGCVGRDRVCDPDRVAGVLEAADADISALQEIDARIARRLQLDPFDYFAERLGWTRLAARTLVSTDGHYGHVLMSRWPIESLGGTDLSVPGREPRKAIVGAVAAPLAPITVVAAHLGLLGAERRAQIDRLKMRLAVHPERPIIAMGDFNETRGRGLAQRSLCPPLEPAPAVATFPSRLPVLPLDRIWCSRPLEMLSLVAVREAYRVSDHLPLLARLRLARP